MNEASQRTKRHKKREGTTLVEVMFGIVILAIMAVGGAAFMYQSRASVDATRNRRAALEAANGRLELVRSSTYDAIKPPAETYTIYHVRRQGSGWTHSVSDPSETVVINTHALPLRTTVQYIDIDGGAGSYDCVEVTVSADYRLATGENVTLQTMVAR